MTAETLNRPGREPRENTPENIQAIEMKLMARTRHESLSVPGWGLWTETFPQTKSTLSGVVAHFGQRVTRESMDQIIAKTISENPQSKEESWSGPLGYSAGFGAIYRAPEEATREEKDAATFEVAVKMAREAIELKGWNPEDVDIVDFANSAAADGMSITLKEKLVNELGMKKDLDVTGTFMACDGAGNALYRRLRDEKSVGKKVLLLTVDSVGSEMPLDPTRADTNSMQIFSNGAAAFTYVPGEDLRLVTEGKTEVHEDEGGALAAITRYAEAIKSDSTIDPEEPTGLIRKIDKERMIRLPHPDFGAFLMRGVATAKFFWEHAESNIAEVCAQYEKAFPGRQLDYATIHHPSFMVFKHLQHIFEKRINDGKQKLELPFKWLVPDGNSSGATSLIAFNRSMEQFKQGDHVMYASFGAGGSFTTFVVEVGGEN